MASVHYVSLNSPTSPTAEVVRWSLCGRVDWRGWDGEFVARVDDSSATYLISALAGEALNALRSGPGVVDEIAARVFRDATATSAGSTLTAIFAETAAETRGLLDVLVELEGRGLVRADRA